MTALASLKLVVAKRPSGLPVIQLRRIRLAGKIAEQVRLAQANIDGKPFGTVIRRTITDPETGSQKVIETKKSAKPWWFVSDTGKVCLSVKYGSKVIELAKGKTAIELTSLTDVIPALEVIQKAIDAGELDAQLEIVSKSLRAGFKKKT